MIVLCLAGLVLVAALCQVCLSSGDGGNLAMVAC
jgi:hypothetical protein